MCVDFPFLQVGRVFCERGITEEEENDDDDDDDDGVDDERPKMC